MTKFVVDNGKNLIQAYDAAETDALLNQKANAEDVYNKTEIDAKDYDLEQRIGAVDNKFADYYPQFAIDMMLDGKANTSGEYDDITAGHAKQLTSRVGETDKTPYNFRTSGGSLDIGDLETDKIIGGSVAWNQKMPIIADQSKTENGVTIVDNRDGSYTISTDANGATADVYVGITGMNANRALHKYYLCGCPKNGSSTTYYIGGRFIWTPNNNIPFDVGNGAIVADNYPQFSDALVIMIKSGCVITTPIVFKPNLFDLTQMFGATIADYIYNLEQSTAGAGVAWFKKLFPKSYYSYNAGQIMSVKTSKHVTVGFNAFDYETGKAQLLGGVEYQITGAYTAISYTDIDGNAETITPDSDGIFTPTNNGEMTVTGGDNSSTCIHIVWDGERNGEYEPYVANEYYLQNDLELRGIFKLDANNKLYADGDEYPDTGNVTRKYGIVDLGSLVYEKAGTGDDLFGSNSLKTLAKQGNYWNEESPNMLCVPYKTILGINVYQKRDDKVIGFDDTGRLYIYDTAYATATPEQFAAAMSGKYLVYELATPTTETVNGYTNPQKVDDFGTEQYVDGREVEIPVGHETFYVANLKAKLEMSPDSPDADGLYLMQHNNGENVYTPYISPIPALPSTDGTFVLKCTVSGTIKTLTWVEET